MRRIAPSIIALTLWGSAGSQPVTNSWLDSASLESWNKRELALPSAPPGPRNPDPRCRELARAPASDEDRQVRARGWDLMGPPTEGGQIRVVGAAADYDGMCRPRQYQYFVFSRGLFAGTLSPGLMDSRTDGALNHLTIQSDHKLKARYARYAAADPLCCPSRTTTVLFGVEKDPPIVTPLTATTSSNPMPAAPKAPQ